MLLSAATKCFQQGFLVCQSCCLVPPPLLRLQVAQSFEHPLASEDTLVALLGQRQLTLQDTQIPFLQPVRTWKIQRMTKNIKKPTIADYSLTFSTRCNASSCAISMPAEVFVLTLCNDDMLHCGPDQHNHPCLATKMDKADMAFRCFFRLFSNNLGSDFLETQLSQQDFKWF